jgi:O-antigen/teichoic acid export membrane protein
MRNFPSVKKESQSQKCDRSYIFDYASTFASSGLIQVFGVITGIMTARLLGPSGKGDLATVLWLPGFLTAAGILALPQAVAFQASYNHENDMNLTSAGFWLSLFWGLLLAVVMYPFIPFIIGNSKLYLLDICRLFLLYLPIVFSGLALLSVDQGRQKFARFNFLRILPTVLYLLGIFILWLMRKANLTTIVLICLLSQLLATWIRAAVAGKSLFFHSFSNWILTAQQLLKRGAVFHIPDIAGVILMRIDMALLIQMVSAQDIGYYSVAMAVSLGQTGLASSIVQVGFPKVAAHNYDEAREILLNQFRFSQPVILCLALAVGLSSPWIIRYAFGSPFLPAVRPTLILVPALALWGLNQILDNGLRAMGYSFYSVAANSIGVIFMVFGGFVLTKLFGITGMASACLLAQFIALTALIFICHRNLQIELGSLWGVNKKLMFFILYKLTKISYGK